jgi:hypothetical protein
MFTSGHETALLAELAKCDLVCANCHRIRTRQRGYRNTPSQSSPDASMLDEPDDGGQEEETGQGRFAFEEAARYLADAAGA